MVVAAFETSTEKAIQGATSTKRKSSLSSVISLTGEGVILDDDTNILDTEEPFAEGADSTLKAVTTKKVALVNLVKNIVGAGILTLPSGLNKASLLTGVGMMIIVAIACASSFILIGFLCRQLHCRTYRQLVSKTFGPAAGILVDSMIFLNSFLMCLALMVTIADLLEKSIPGLFDSQAPPRFLVIAIATVVAILPLAHVRNLAPLKYTSIIGLFGLAYVVVLVQKDFLQALAEGRSRLSDNVFQLDSGILFAACLFSSAFKAHYNAPIYYTELGGDLSAYSRVTVAAYVIVFLLYFLFILGGVGVFGNDVLGNVLRNFPQGRVEVLWAWLLMAFTVIFTYPLILKSGRDAILGLLPVLAQMKESSPDRAHVVSTTTFVLAVSGLACCFNDVSIVMGFVGATIGAALLYLLPAAVYMKLASMSRQGGEASVPWSPGLYYYSGFLLMLGVVIAIGGSFIVIMSAWGA